MSDILYLLCLTHNFQSCLMLLNLLFHFHSQPLYFLLGPADLLCYCDNLQLFFLLSVSPCSTPSTLPHSASPMIAMPWRSTKSEFHIVAWKPSRIWLQPHQSSLSPSPWAPQIIPLLQSSWILFHLGIFSSYAPVLGFHVERRSDLRGLRHQGI